MADILTDELISDFREAFALFDNEGNGTISVNDFGSVMRATGQCPSEAEIAELVAKADTAKTGFVTFRDFLEVVGQRIRVTDTEEELIEAFQVFDRDGKGYISCDDLRHVMTNLGERLTQEEADLMIAEADTDGDGLIKYEEFVKMMLAK